MVTKSLRRETIESHQGHENNNPMNRLRAWFASSLSSKVGIVVLVTTFIALALALSLSSWREAHSQKAALVDQRASVGEVVAANLSPSLVFNDPVTAKAVLLAVSQIPSIRDSYVLDKDGQVFVSQSQHGPERLVSALDSRLGSDRLETRVPIMINRDRVGELVLVTSLTDLNRTIVQNALISGLISIVAMVFALLIGLKLIGLVIEPVRRLSAAISHVREARDFSSQVDCTSTDELWQFDRRFNSLLLWSSSQNDAAALKASMVELTEARDLAEAANVAKSEFLANMSHEIRTPMNGVIGMNALLLRTELTPLQIRYAENVRVSADCLLAIINDILDVSKLEAGKRSSRELIDFRLQDRGRGSWSVSLFDQGPRLNRLEIASFVDDGARRVPGLSRRPRTGPASGP